MNGLASGVFTGDTLLGVNNTPWVDYSQQSTIVGWTSFTNKILEYVRIGNVLFVNVYISGTSNSTATSITLPYVAKAVSTSAPLVQIQNSGATFIGGAANITVGSNVIIFSRWSSTSVLTSAWTASGTKLIQGQFFYEI